MLISNDLVTNYLKASVNNTFKILPLYEEENENVGDYVNSLVSEMNGLLEGQYLSQSVSYLSYLATLKGLEGQVKIIDNQKIVKREVFKCLNLINKLIDETLKGVE